MRRTLLFDVFWTSILHYQLAHVTNLKHVTLLSSETGSMDGKFSVKLRLYIRVTKAFTQGMENRHDFFFQNVNRCLNLSIVCSYMTNKWRSSNNNTSKWVIYMMEALKSPSLLFLFFNVILSVSPNLYYYCPFLCLKTFEKLHHELSFSLIMS